jgi:tripartite-type tricarboxylate transporter receptor subunit TctC
MITRFAIMGCALSFLTGAGLTTSSSPSAADPVADFYAGKQIQMIIRSTAGTSYDTYARLLGTHMVKHIPGKPTIVPVNMPGAGGLKAANYVAKIAPRDGTVLTIIGQGMPLYQALNLGPGFEGDLREFNWVGNIDISNQLLVTWHTSPVKTLEDARKREAVIGASGDGSNSVQLAAVYNNILGTKFRIITGYESSAALNLALERGEIDGKASGLWQSYMVAKPDWIAGKKLNVIIQTGLKKEADLSDVPLLIDAAQTPEQREILDYITKTVVVGRPFATTPGVPKERVAALRRAFDLAVVDPEFLADAKKQQLDLNPQSGAELEKVVNYLIDAPESLRKKVDEAMKPKSVEQKK